MEEKIIHLTIDGVEVEVPEGTTVLEAARKANIDIPTLCFLKDINEFGEFDKIEQIQDDLIIKECQLVKEKENIIQTNEKRLKPLRELNQILKQ